jgi:hypothetical protein
MPSIDALIPRSVTTLESAYAASRAKPQSTAVETFTKSDAKSAYDDAVALSDRLAQGAKAAASYATSKDLDAKKERLRLLKLFADTATDPRAIRNIAREVAEIARSLGNAAPPAAEAAPSADAPATPGDTGDADSIRGQVNELMTLAKKILEKLRALVVPGTREAQEVEKAAREVNKTLAAYGLTAPDPTQSLTTGTNVTTNIVAMSVEATISINIKV